jgi:Bacterial lipocalin
VNKKRNVLGMKIVRRLVMFLLAFNHQGYANPPLKTVSSLDLHRYTGKWYEIARLPNRFQKQCASDVSATYDLLTSGDLAVVNTCLKENGQWSVAKGIAWFTEQPPGSKLKVSFVPWLKHFHLFGGDYWILDLDPGYQWSIVGSPDRKYLWILSRTPSLSAHDLSLLLQRAQDLGFDVTCLIRTPHTNNP